MNKKTLAKIAAAVVVVAGGVLAYRAFGWGAMNGPVNSLKIDLSKPDALVVTKSLSSLPRDLLTVPLALTCCARTSCSITSRPKTAWA